jgi:hypothetical protein
MQNGALAEARSAALLLERFWILDRSVDIEGADHIIQRRLSGRSLLDPSPPRLGYVQSKFYASEETTQYIHRAYVLTPEGEARGEFFLLAHTGAADAANVYFVPRRKSPRTSRSRATTTASLADTAFPAISCSAIRATA